MAAKRDKIRAGLGVVVSLEANGSSVMDIGVVFHGISCWGVWHMPDA
jgi:hypothetical protein